ncbi:hypothetical protein IscW_ISCW009171 [Ixodes scapularis]|uniref:Uncharacterized protein n=1 Tax=Ixodes scapularis TaxID=6945 RepID=B7Q1B2_IXOSC|nr:hypothetical protein IscW_ISCW009171 [Ixodes scapularis]|eukprot:XP_002409240.1 hypothetical protein IscW_ISCW009171 [Ixodes scapularis]
MARGHSAVLVTIDIHQAFDALPHAPIIDALRRLGVTGRSLSFVRAFLSDRTVTVKGGKEKSSPRHLTRGVPQGSADVFDAVEQLVQEHNETTRTSGAIDAVPPIFTQSRLAELQGLLKPLGEATDRHQGDGITSAILHLCIREKRVGTSLYKLCSTTEGRAIAHLFGQGRSTVNELYSFVQSSSQLSNPNG